MSTNGQSIVHPMDCTAWRFWTMRPLNGCSRPAPKSSGLAVDSNNSLKGRSIPAGHEKKLEFWWILNINYAYSMQMTVMTQLTSWFCKLSTKKIESFPGCILKDWPEKRTLSRAGITDRKHILNVISGNSKGGSWVGHVPHRFLIAPPAFFCNFPLVDIYSRSLLAYNILNDNLEIL